MRLRLLCTKTGLKSNSLREIAQGLSTKLGYKVYRGTGERENRTHFRYGDLVDKLAQYKWFKKNNVPSFEFTEDSTVVQQWLKDGCVVFGRQLLNASCGKGIVVLEPEAKEVPPCPVYTKYIPKKREFRVHIFNQAVVAVVEKKLRSDWDGPRNSRIRNLDNGYVFVQTVDNEPPMLRDVALKACGVTKSHFVGVDIGYNEKANFCFVIEVNSAPGVQGTNVEKYVKEIIKYA